MPGAELKGWIECPRCGNKIRFRLYDPFGAGEPFMPTEIDSDYHCEGDCFICKRCKFRISAWVIWGMHKSSMEAQMPPKRRYTTEIKIEKVRRGQPAIVEPDEASNGEEQ